MLDWPESSKLAAVAERMYCFSRWYIKRLGETPNGGRRVIVNTGVTVALFDGQQGEADMVSRKQLSQTRGFTLIEISIVLVVIGLLISGGLVALAPVLENAKRTETENTITKVENAILAYAVANSCLPCPADATAPADIGQQVAAGATVGTACAGTDACFLGADGVVPYVTLGLSDADAIDAWGNLISYYVSTTGSTGGGLTCDDFQNSALASASGFTRDPDGAVGARFPQGCLNVSDVAGTVRTAEAAYVLISHGPDQSGAYDVGGNLKLNPRSPGNTAQEANADGNCDGSPCRQDTPVDIEGNGYFDDIVRWRIGRNLVFDCGPNACGNPG